jgi:integrase
LSQMLTGAKGSKDPERDRLLILLLYTCALRVSELSKLEVADVNLDEKTITIQTSKTSKHQPQKLPIPDFLAERLKTYLTGKQPGDPVIRLCDSGAYKRLKSIAKRVEISEEVTPQALRRSRTQHLLKAELSPFLVRDLLRHKNLSGMKDYVEPGPMSVEKLREGLKTFDSVFFNFLEV